MRKLNSIINDLIQLSINDDKIDEEILIELEDLIDELQDISIHVYNEGLNI